MMEVKKELVHRDEYEEWDILLESGMFMCPCGTVIEDDGKCPNGHVSPLRQEKMI